MFSKHMALSEYSDVKVEHIIISNSRICFILTALLSIFFFFIYLFIRLNVSVYMLMIYK